MDNIKTILQEEPNFHFEFNKLTGKKNPIIQYIGGGNFPNVGDQAIFHYFKAIFSDCEVRFQDCTYPLTRSMADEEIKNVKQISDWTDEEKNEKIKTLNSHVFEISSDVDLVVLVGGSAPPIWIHFISSLLDNGYKCALFGSCFTKSFTYTDTFNGTTYTIDMNKYRNIEQYIRNIYNKASFIGVRDCATQKIFARYCGSSENVVVIGDPVNICSRYRLEYTTVSPSRLVEAFQYKDVFSSSKYILLDKSVCGLSFGSEWHTSISIEEKKHLLKYIVGKVKEKFNKILVFSFSLRDYEFNKDLLANIDGLEIVTNYTNHWKIIELMKTCSIFIGERLHSVIFSTSLGLPTVSLTYHEKCFDYMQTILMEKYCLQLNYKNDLYLSFDNMLNDLILNAENITINLDSVVGYYQSKLYQVSRYIVDKILSNYDTDVLKCLNKEINWSMRTKIYDTYGSLNYNTLKQYLTDDQKEKYKFDKKEIFSKLKDSFPHSYIDANNYITKFYPTNLFTDNVGYGPNIEDLKESTSGIIDDVDLQNKNKIPLSSYLIYLNNGYCSQEFKLNGYSGNNMLIDKEGRMLKNYLWHFGPCCWGWHHNKWGQQHLRKFTNYTYFSGKVVCLLSNDNYGHWLHDIVSSLHLIEQENIGQHKVYLNTFNKKEYIVTSLISLGYQESNIIFAEEHPVIRAEHLYLPVQQPRQVVWMKDWLRLKFRNITPSEVSTRNIYIGRNLDSHRRILNENHLMKMLEKYNFEYISTIRDLTFKETITLFKQCKTIIMSHGANCMNTHWCNEGTNVIYITNEKLKKYHGYFKECYTNKYINFYEYLCNWTDFDRLEYSKQFNCNVEDAWEHWKNRNILDYPSKDVIYDDKWDMYFDIESFETYLQSISVI